MSRSLIVLPPKLGVPLLMTLSAANQIMSLRQLKADMKPIKQWWPDGPAPYLLQQGFACAGELLRGTAAEAAITVEVPMILRYDNKFEESNMRVMKTIWNTVSMLVRRS